jgi:S1-C subfamily serine protease
MSTPGSIAPVSPGRRRIVALLAALAFFVVPFLAGYQIGHDHNGSSASPSASTFAPTTPSQSNGGFNFPGSSNSGNSGSRATPGSTGGGLDAAALTDKTDDSVVNLRIAYPDNSGEAAGTGIVISPSGLVLTNNHVIANAQEIQAEFATTGATKSAKVLGYSLVGDVALIQIQGASNLKAAELGDSSTLQVGDPILALGNAGGAGGEPAAVTGRVTDLGRSITASDADGSNVQTLQNLIEVNANIRPGDSGGPLVDANGKVVGMNAAASVSGGSFRLPGQSGTTQQGYAIPIEDALKIAKTINSGTSTADVHVGSDRALLGVGVRPDTNAGGFGSRSNGNGAGVIDIRSGSAADKAGIAVGDTITRVDNLPITSGSDLTKAMVRYSPGQSVQVSWIDSSGSTHHATVKLGSGTPA